MVIGGLGFLVIMWYNCYVVSCIESCLWKMMMVDLIFIIWNDLLLYMFVIKDCKYKVEIKVKCN